MLIYLNSGHEIPVGAKIEVPNMMVLFQELIHAVTEAVLDKKKDSNAYTYAAIIDEPLHDPLVQKQIDAVYVPNPLGLYPANNKGGLIYDDFIKAITSTKSSMQVFMVDRILDQIRDLGFSGVWVFDDHKRQIITLKSFNALIIKHIK
tara:strand:- start:1478 stop:1921 length:444 start_codon:yes stop_codon:yes gene_type:complete